MPQFCVGDDAHIVPANMTDFSKIFGEFVGAQWGDVGIAPYEPPGSAQKFVGADASVRPEESPISPQVFAFRMCGLRGDRVVAPYGENGGQALPKEEYQSVSQRPFWQSSFSRSR